MSLFAKKKISIFRRRKENLQIKINLFRPSLAGNFVLLIDNAWRFVINYRIDYLLTSKYHNKLDDCSLLIDYGVSKKKINNKK